MLPTQRDSPTSATSGVLILEPHAEASQKKHLDMPEPFSPTFTADQSGGQPIQKDVAFEQDDELSEDAHCDDQANSLDAVDFVSDFVDKLFTALENPNLHSILAWGPLRDCFFVIDIEKCATTILPQLYKHHNFASFVRQLNEYGFQKVANASDDKFGEQAWCFKHLYFHADRPQDLPDVKRIPSTDKKNIGEGDEGTSSGSLPYNSNDSYSSPIPNACTPSDNLSPYPPSSRSPSNDHISGSKRIVDENRSRSASPTRATLYSEMQTLKYDAEKFKARIKVLDEMSESMRADMEDAREMLAEHGEILRTLAAQRAKMISQDNVQRTGGGGPVAQ